MLVLFAIKWNKWILDYGTARRVRLFGRLFAGPGPWACFAVASALFIVFVGLYAAAEELDERLHVEVIPAGLDQRFPVAALQDVVGLCIHTVGLQRVVGVDLPETLEDLSGIGRDPVLLGQHLLVVRVEGADDIVVAQDLQHLGVGPYAGLHFSAVHAAVAREVDEQGFPTLAA